MSGRSTEYQLDLTGATEEDFSTIGHALLKAYQDADGRPSDQEAIGKLLDAIVIEVGWGVLG
jgi:hypothetical protein